MAANWLTGQVARLTAEVLNVSGQLADPSVLRLKVKTPGGVVSVFAWPGAPEVVHTGPGAFHADIPMSEPGVWAFRFESDGMLMGAAERTLTVRKSLFD